MKAYLITTGAVFGLITIAHILRIIDEGPQIVRDPFFILTTTLAIGLGLWALRLLLSSGRGGTQGS